jgi:hypothetical protein
MDAMTSPRSRSLVLTVAATAATVVLAGCGSDDPKDTASDPAASDTSSPEPTDGTSEPSSPATSDGGEPGTVAVPIYFVGDGPRGPVLFREFRSVEEDNPLVEAAALLTAGDTLDRDYRTLFPGGAFTDITYDEALNLITAVVPDDGWAAPGDLTKAEAKLAVQSLVYTLQGVVGQRAPVTVTLGGASTSLFGIDTAGGVKDAPQLEVLNLVSVTTPEEGATVSGTFTATGVASSFEATVPWEIRQGDEVVKTGFSTAEGWMEKLYPWTTEVDVSDLAPGDYTFVALTDDPSGGAEGHGPSEDTKSITVE